MLFSRRNHGAKGLLQDATRASSRVAEQAGQTLSGLADDSRTLAQTARTELGGLSRDVRDQAGGKVTRARRRTAKKLSEAASAVEPTEKRRGRPVVKALFAAVAGWLLVNVARKAKQKKDEASASTTDETTPTAGSAGTGAASAGSTSTGSTGATGTGSTKTSATKPKATAGSATNKANSSGS